MPNPSFKIHKKILLGLTEDEYSRLEKLRFNRGLRNSTDVIRVCIAEVFKREFPAYIYSKPKKMTPEEKVESQMVIEQAKIRAKEQIQLDICEKLGGKENDGYCFYQTYSIVPGNEVEVYNVQEPIEMLTDEYLDFQYRNLFNQTGEEAKKQVLKLLAKQNKQDETI